MKIKYSPIKSKHETKIEKVNEYCIKIDEEEYEFDEQSVLFPEIAETTDGKIISAYKKGGELYLTITRYYKDSCSSWDTGKYQRA